MVLVGVGVDSFIVFDMGMTKGVAVGVAVFVVGLGLLVVSGEATVRVGMVALELVHATMGVAVFMEQEEADDVGQQAAGTNDQDQLGIGNDRRTEHSLERLDQDGEAQGYEEDRIDEGAQDLCTQPAVCVLGVGRTVLGDVDCPKGDKQRDNVVQHVERVCNKRQRVDRVPDNDFQKEKHSVDHQESGDLYLLLR